MKSKLYDLRCHKNGIEIMPNFLHFPILVSKLPIQYVRHTNPHLKFSFRLVGINDQKCQLEYLVEKKCFYRNMFCMGLIRKFLCKIYKVVVPNDLHAQAKLMLHKVLDLYQHSYNWKFFMRKNRSFIVFWKNFGGQIPMHIEEP